MHYNTLTTRNCLNSRNLFRSFDRFKAHSQPGNNKGRILKSYLHSKMKTVSQKMGIKENSRALFINAPIDAIDGMKLPEIEIIKRLTGKFDYIHLFVKSQLEYKNKFPKLKPHLKADGMLWASWQKGGAHGRIRGCNFDS